MTPERKVPELAEIPKKVWESNIPIGDDWGYVPNDRFKSAQELLETFVDVVSKGGNLILGVGPKPDGTFTDEETKILQEIGNWLNIYGEGIYETRSQPKEWQNQWKLTYSKDQTIHYAFQSIRFTQEKIFLADIEADKHHVIKDLSTKKELEVYTEEDQIYILSSELEKPAIGLIGLEILKKPQG